MKWDAANLRAAMTNHINQVAGQWRGRSTHGTS
jgi:hypothetical protein